MADTGIYLFTGPEAGEKNEAIENIRQTVKKQSGTLDEYKYYVSDIRVADVVAQLQNVSLFSSALFIVLCNAEEIKNKDDIKQITSWAASNSSNTLILVTDEFSVDKKLDEAVPSNHKRKFFELFENKKEQWIVNFFKKNNFNITPDAVSEILNMVENDTETLRSECSKFLYCFERSHTVSVSDVNKILTHNKEENAFTLFDSMCEPGKNPNQRFENAVEILNKIRISKESNSVMLISGLAYCFRQLKTWHALTFKGKVPSTAELKAARLDSKTNQTRYKNASAVWSPGVTASILSLLGATDMAIRENGTAMEDTRLIMMIYSIVIKNGLYCAQYE
ncbi:MAG: DNA polymerase III subunit delta [Treponema sp.]|nr:DNA polymerase III subunit delta [Spirochaetia bacterium]MDD7014680.1 DNA polymerase III subunit delta [Spirochaetales bacterium]MDY4902474.1 DNA polymerase III subunit delta [Treponema sp.]